MQAFDSMSVSLTLKITLRVELNPSKISAQNKFTTKRLWCDVRSFLIQSIVLKARMLHRMPNSTMMVYVVVTKVPIESSGSGVASVTFSGNTVSSVEMCDVSSSMYARDVCTASVNTYDVTVSVVMSSGVCASVMYPRLGVLYTCTSSAPVVSGSGDVAGMPYDVKESDVVCQDSAVDLGCMALVVRRGPNVVMFGIDADDEQFSGVP